MHLELVLIGLATLAVAMPLDKRSDDSVNQAQDINYKLYADYHPYYQYGKYGAPAEAEAAKSQQEESASNMKRDNSLPKVEGYTEYGKYYGSYGDYPAPPPSPPSDGEAAKVNANTHTMKRHMMNMPEDMMHTDGSSEKRDAPKEVETAWDTWYQRYE
ncbi:hypothetical protein J4E91_007197 [Alternaria rosae]|nr:hypothetical protein J4E91_007197 [Alternaria rosae]